MIGLCTKGNNTGAIIATKHWKNLRNDKPNFCT